MKIDIKKTNGKTEANKLRHAFRFMLGWSVVFYKLFFQIFLKFYYGKAQLSPHKKAVMHKLSHVRFFCTQIAQRINYAPSTITHLIQHGLVNDDRPKGSTQLPKSKP